MISFPFVYEVKIYVSRHKEVIALSYANWQKRNSYLVMISFPFVYEVKIYVSRHKEVIALSYANWQKRNSYLVHLQYPLCQGETWKTISCLQ